MGQLDGKVAIITGSARGTGEATARRFVAEGARVLLGDVLDDLGKQVAQDLGDAAEYVHLDITREDDWAAAVAHVTDRYATPTVLVNNAAILVVRALEDTSLAEFEDVLRTNVTGAFLGIRTLIGPMKAAGGGSIVNISSIDGLGGGNGRSAYCSSKWGVRGLTKTAALELGRFAIRVNAVCPSGGSVEMVEPWSPPDFDPTPVYEAIAMKRAPELDELAQAVTWLASDSSVYVTGSDLVIDGGFTAGKIIQGYPGS
jgi:3alpha(or 20beta)-hydroxysteroid dehydrogenase